jgi:hypothetical protein
MSTIYNIPLDDDFPTDADIDDMEIERQIEDFDDPELRDERKRAALAAEEAEEEEELAQAFDHAMSKND